jgi:hypothetical protein
MKIRPIASETYRRVMQSYETEDRKRTEVIRVIGKQRIQTSREQTKTLYAFYRAVINSRSLSSSNN